MLRLGVNIDHVASLRQARGTPYPEPVQAALLAEEAGADGITLHLREDRRHIQDRDVCLLIELLQTPMNLEIAATGEMLTLAEKIHPPHCCLVPEKRQELTTEGGLDVIARKDYYREVCARLRSAGIRVSLFIDPELHQVEAAAEIDAPVIELHTGDYAEAEGVAQSQALVRLQRAADVAAQAELEVHAGHGLHYRNVEPIAAMPLIRELNIGHSIVARAMFVGLKAAITEMKQLMLAARRHS